MQRSLIITGSYKNFLLSNLQKYVFLRIKNILKNYLWWWVREKNRKTMPKYLVILN